MQSCSLGSEWIEEERAYNFSLYSQHAESVTLLLFGEDDPAAPLLEHRLDPRVNKTWHVWHCRLESREVRGARYYAYEDRRSAIIWTAGLARLRPAEGLARSLRQGRFLPTLV